MTRLGWLGGALLAGIAAVPLRAADFTDPDWPCIQRKMTELSIGQMWGGPMPEPSSVRDPQIEALVQRVSPRRVPVEEVAAQATELVAGLEGEARAQRLAEVFAALLRRINVERSEIIEGIGRYARRQTEMSGRVDAMQIELAHLRAAPEDARNWDRIEELEDAVAWEARVFKERAQSLTYVCEAPVLLEQRAFAIARALAALS